MQFSAESAGEYRFACIEGLIFGAMPRGVPPPPGRLFNWRDDDSSALATMRADCRRFAGIALKALCDAQAAG